MYLPEEINIYKLYVIEKEKKEEECKKENIK